MWSGGGFWLFFGWFWGCLWVLVGFLGVVECVLGLAVLLWDVCWGFRRLNSKYFEILYTIYCRARLDSPITSQIPRARKHL